MRNFGRLQSNAGTACTLGFDFDSDFSQLLNNGEVDCFIFATENGFSPLGSALGMIAKELQIPGNEIVKLADWNRFENKGISNVCFKNKNEESRLRGVVLAACENSKCYTGTHDGAPHRNFYYNVSYEAIYYAAMVCGAKKIAVTHLSASGNYHADIATCTAEALAHFHDEFPNKITSLSFVGCCIQESHLRGIQRLNAEKTSKHNKIQTTTKALDYGELVSLF